MDPDKLVDLDVHVQCTLFLKEGTEFGEKKKLYTQSAVSRRKKSCLRGLGNNKGADQPAHVQPDQHLFYSLIGKYHILTCYK